MSSQSNIAALTLALSNINQQIATISANPRPSYSINGQSVQWGEFLKQLLDAQQSINEKLAIATGPTEDVWEGIT